MSQIKNRKHCLSTKTNTRRADEWNGGQFLLLLLLFSARKEITSRKPTLQSQIWADIYYTLYFPNCNPWAELLLIYLTIFLPFGRKRYFEETNNCTRRFTRHILFDANRNTLVKPTSRFFYQRNKWLHQNIHCWHKYELIFVALYILQMTIRGRIQVATVNPMKMLIPINHKHYVEAGQTTTTLKFPVIISFIRTNTRNIRLFQTPAGNTARKLFPEISVEIASLCSDF